MFDTIIEPDEQANAFSRMSPDDKLAFLENIRRVKTEAAGAFLNKVYPGEGSKSVRKLIRKLIFQLKSAGITVEEPSEGGETVLRNVKEVLEHRAFMTNYDFSQTRLIVAEFQVKKNRFVFVNAEIHFSHGLLEMMTSPVERNAFETILQTYRDDTKAPMMLQEISPAYGTFLLEEASARSGKFRDDVKTFRSLATDTRVVRTPEDIYRLPVSDTIQPVAPETLLDHQVFLPFFITWATMEQDVNEYNSTGGRLIVLPEYLQAKKKAEFVDALIERYNMRSAFPLLRRMLEDYAYLLYQMKEFRYYIGAIQFLKSEGAADKTLLHFLQKSLQKGAQKPENKDQGGQLIVNPYG